MEQEPTQFEYTDRKPPGKSLEDTPRPVLEPVMSHDFAHYQKLMKAQQAQASEYIEIGPRGWVRQSLRVLVWLLALLMVAGLFTVLFYHFTNSFRVALVIVACMLLYMFAMAQLAEGKIDERDRRR